MDLNMYVIDRYHSQTSQPYFMSQDFYESIESTMQMKKAIESCSSWSRDHISDIKSQSDQDDQWSSQESDAVVRLSQDLLFGLDMSEKWGGMGTRFSDF